MPPYDRKNAERAGFEPAVGCDPYNGLASRRDRPLCHLSTTRRVTPSYLQLTYSSRRKQDFRVHFCAAAKP
jgi:hypothetical protein